jgi:hypothetical protein
MKCVAVACCLALIAMSSSSEAGRGPRCDGDFQFVRGGWAATPYCRADQIARVAREMGVRTSAEALLAHPADAEEVCRIVGADYRVHPACEELYSTFQVDVGTGGAWLHFR